MVAPMAAALILTMLTVLLSNYFYLYSIVMGISDYAEQAVLQTAESNAFNAYSGVREGNSTASYYAGSGMWQSLVSTSEMSYRLQQTLGMSKTGSGLYKYRDDGSLKYAITQIDVTCSNVAVASDGNSVTLTFHTTLKAEIPMSFLGVSILTVHPVDLISYYAPMF